MHLGILFGWDMTMVANSDHCRIHISHDGYVELVPGEGADPAAFRSSMEELGREMKPDSVSG